MPSNWIFASLSPFLIPDGILPCAHALFPMPHCTHAQGLVSPTAFFQLAGHPTAASTLILDELLVQPPWAKDGSFIPFSQYLAEYGVAMLGGCAPRVPSSAVGDAQESKGVAGKRRAGTAPVVGAGKA